LRERGSDLYLIPLVVSLFHIDRCIHSNSEPEKCCPTNRTIVSLLSYSKLNDITEVHQTIDFFYKLKPIDRELFSQPIGFFSTNDKNNGHILFRERDRYIIYKSV